MIGGVLAHYEILAPLGAGGMGEVYRARDLKLGRDVAIKVLPEGFAEDPDRLARLEREARLLASLNHANIATIHGFDEHDGNHFIVLELVEGRTLEDHLAAGALPLDRALDICRQIAEALEAAHEAGIIHRDLKPANVVVTPHDSVKVLDFGIAKAQVPEPVGVATGKVTELTLAGTLIGTAPYMSPEQVRGDTVDKRADIWSFGCLMFEILAGQRAFRGETVADTLAAILELEPDFDAVPEGIPETLLRLLRRCLEKKPRDRLRDIGDARIEIVDATSARLPSSGGAVPARQVGNREPAGAGVVMPWGTGATGSASRGRRHGPWLAGIVVGIVLGTAASSLWYGTPTGQTVVPSRGAIRFSIGLPAGLRLTGIGGSVLAISGDGRRIAFAANRQIYVRDLDAAEARPIPGTRLGGARWTRDLFLSHDGQWIGFTAGGQWMKASASAGGAIRPLWPMEDRPSRPHWTPDDQIIFARGEEGIWRGFGGGGSPEPLITLRTGERAYGPQLLPDGEWVLYTLRPAGADSMAEARLVAESLATGTREALIEGRSGRYLSTGHLVYAVGDALLAAPFDPATRTLTGDPVRLVESVYTWPAGGRLQYDVSETGTLVYLPRATIASTRSLVWVDRGGDEEEIAAPPRLYSSPRVSPDGTKILVGVSDADGGGRAYWDIAGAVLTPLPFEGPSSSAWAHDSSRVVVAVDRPDGGRDMYSMPIDGSSAVHDLLTTPWHARPMVGTLDGGVIYVQRGPGSGGMDILWFRPGEISPRELFATDRHEGRPVLSPDGRWLAYESDETGRIEIWVASFHDVTRFRRRISTRGGVEPKWSPLGDELYYVQPDEGLMMAVPVDTGDAFVHRAAEPLFSVDDYDLPLVNSPNYDVAPDGRFVFMRPAGTGGDPGAGPYFNVVVDWAEELRGRSPAR